MKTKFHEFVIKVKFDKPCGKRTALSHVKDQIQNHSEYPYYLDTYGYGDEPKPDAPEKMNVKIVTGVKKVKQTGFKFPKENKNCY